MDWMILVLLAAALPEEPDLARRLRQKDPAALSTLYDRYGRLVYRLVLHIVRDPAASEDIVQDTFARVWSSTHLIAAETAQVGPWVLTIARNRALDFVRSAHSRSSVQEAFARHEDHFTYDTAEGSLITQENARLVAKALATLNP